MLLTIAAVGAILFVIGSWFITRHAMFSDPDPFASHRRAVHRAGLTLISSEPEERTKAEQH
jgi:hypothetical protein